MNLWKYAVSYARTSPATAPLPLDGPLETALETAARIGYDAIEIHMRENAPFDLNEYRAMTEKYGIGICSVVTGRLFTEGKCSLLDDAVYVSERAIQGIREYILLAEKLNADIVIGWVKGTIPPGGDRACYLERLSGYLSELGEFAGQHHVRILLEVINRYETNIFNTATETADYIRRHNLSNCYVHLDTFHMNIEETDPCKAIHYCGNLLGYFHVADSTRLYPGSGQIDFPKIFQALKEVDYSGYVDVECFPSPGRIEAASQALSALRGYDSLIS